jgi:hypothetical protein
VDLGTVTIELCNGCGRVVLMNDREPDGRMQGERPSHAAYSVGRISSLSATQRNTPTLVQRVRADTDNL